MLGNFLYIFNNFKEFYQAIQPKKVSLVKALLDCHIYILSCVCMPSEVSVTEARPIISLLHMNSPEAIMENY